MLLDCRVVILKAMRNDVLKQLRASHQGQDRTLDRARQAVFWPGISNDVRNAMRSRAECAERLPSQPAEPLMQNERPSRPSESMVAEFFQFAGKNYLVLADRLPGWPMVSHLSGRLSSANVIRRLKDWFTQKSIPVRLTTDGGPQFSSRQFKDFCGQWGIFHELSSPLHPKANGATEAAVKTVKGLLAKTSKNGSLDSDAFRKGIIELRNTPQDCGLSPAQIVFGHPMQSNVVTHPRAFRQEWQKGRSEADQ